MKLTRFILILIAGLAIMGFNTTGFALEEIDRPDYMVEEFEPEAAEEEELLAEPEYEAGSIEEYGYLVEEFEPESESMEEEYLVDEETVKPVKGEGRDEHFIPEVY